MPWFSLAVKLKRIYTSTLLKLFNTFLSPRLTKRLRFCNDAIWMWHLDIFFNFLKQTQMNCLWNTFHINSPVHMLPGRLCWLGLDFRCLQQLWKYDGCNSAWCVFKCMKLFLAACCFAWCHCAVCVNGSSVGGGLITQAPFVCTPPQLRCQRMNLGTRFGDKLM